MKIDLFYIEGEHDSVPGIARSLAATEKAAKAEADDLIKAGAKVFRQNMSVEVPQAYSHLEMEAALCVWEHLNEVTVVGEQPSSPAWMEYREAVGSVELRHESIKIGQWVLEVYELLPEWYRASGAYDWEIIPAMVSCLTPGETSRDPATTKLQLLTHESAKEEYFRSSDWEFKRRYGITIEDAGLSKAEFLETWFNFDVEPIDQVKRYGEKYDLEAIR
ncbi:hypothetical protein [Mesorhizobium sp. M0843]|uniref:hypothetical protein n=1 Tax=Mesorhizobium sp. M0843 TaxID=2957010 RepID=UPI00333A6465